MTYRHSYVLEQHGETWGMGRPLTVILLWLVVEESFHTVCTSLEHPQDQLCCPSTWLCPYVMHESSLQWSPSIGRVSCEGMRAIAEQYENTEESSQLPTGYLIRSGQEKIPPMKWTRYVFSEYVPFQL